MHIKTNKDDLRANKKNANVLCVTGGNCAQLRQSEFGIDHVLS